MSIPVWIWTSEYPVTVRHEIRENILDDGSDTPKTVQHEVPFTGYDGTGQSRTDRKGRLIFSFPATRRNYAGDEQFKTIFRFLVARKEAGNESFYFYNPAEYLTPDPTGVVTTGRYLVKSLDSLVAVWTKLTLWDFANLTFREVKG